MEEILHSITAAGYKQLRGRGMALYRFDPLSGSFPDLWYLENNQIARQYRAQVPSDVTTTAILHAADPVLVRDTGKAEGLSPRMLAHSGSFVGVPVHVYGVPWGVLYVNSPETNAFTEDDLDFFWSMARQIGIFVGDSRMGNSPSVEVSTVRVLAATVDAKDNYTRNHSSNVAMVARRMAREMKLDPAEVHRIDLAGLLHDIGKIAIPDQVLQKPGELDPQERLLIQAHAAIGANILAQAPHLKHLVPLVRHHHEWHNGGGYPDGLKGSEVPLGAAILSLADAFDAMTTPRIYRPAFALAVTMGEIRRCAGSQFSPEVVDALERVIRHAEQTQEPWLVSLGQAPDYRRGPGEWPGAMDGEPGPFTQDREPLEFLAEAQMLKPLDDLTTVLGRAGRQAMNYWAPDALQIYLMDSADSTLHLSWCVGTPAAKRFLDACRQEACQPAAHGLLGWVALTNQGITVVDARHDPRWSYGSAFDVPVSVLVAPISAGGRPIGVLQLVARGEGRFGRADAKAVKIFSSLLGCALDRVQSACVHHEDSMSDSLTGLYNSNYLPTVLEEIEGGSWPWPISVAFLDGDDLKHSNAEHGHETGNLLIQHIARCLSAHRRETDVLIRYAGDEFLIFFPGLSLPESSAVVERMRMAVAETPMEVALGERLNVSVSCGVTEASSQGEPHAAMRAAELAMYNAKRSGKNRVWVTAV